MITITINDKEAQAAVTRLAGRCANLRPAMRDLGEYMIEATRQRFVKGEAPDGSKWKSNSPATLRAQAYRKAGGTVLRRGEGARVPGGSLAGKKPGIGESKRLSTEIVARPGGNRVEISSGLEYAATFHHGAKKGAFGRMKRPPSGGATVSNQGRISCMSRWLISSPVIVGIWDRRVPSGIRP